MLVIYLVPGIGLHFLCFRDDSQGTSCFTLVRLSVTPKSLYDQILLQFLSDHSESWNRYCKHSVNVHLSFGKKKTFLIKLRPFQT